MCDTKKLATAGVDVVILEALIAEHKLEGSSIERTKDAVATHIMGAVGKKHKALRQLFEAGWKLVDKGFAPPPKGPISRPLRLMMQQRPAGIAGALA